MSLARVLLLALTFLLGDVAESLIPAPFGAPLADERDDLDDEDEAVVVRPRSPREPRRPERDADRLAARLTGAPAPAPAAPSPRPAPSAGRRPLRPRLVPPPSPAPPSAAEDH